MISPQHLRPGNWIYPTGRTQYRVVTGLLLGMMEKNEDFCKEFEYIPLTKELIELIKPSLKWGLQIFEAESGEKGFSIEANQYIADEENQIAFIQNLDQLQNIYFFLVGEELPMPESAKIIPQTTP